MTDEERDASDGRLRLMLLVAGVTAALFVVGLIVMGKALSAPSSAFDADGTARALGEGVSQVSASARAEAAKLSVSGEAE